MTIYQILMKFCDVYDNLSHFNGVLWCFNNLPRFDGARCRICDSERPSPLWSQPLPPSTACPGVGVDTPGSSKVKG